MTNPYTDGDRCPDHRGQPAHNCGICRSERLADPDHQPARRPALCARCRRELNQETS